MSFSNAHNGYIGNGINASSIHTDALDLGYACVQQLTDFTTGVEINAPAGCIILDATDTLGTGLEAEFLVTNSQVRRNSMIFLQLTSDQTDTFVTTQVKNITAGSFTIQVACAANMTAGLYSLDFVIMHVN